MIQQKYGRSSQENNMATNFTIKPRRNEPQDRLIKRFLKKTKKSGLIEELRNRRDYKKPSDKRRRARQKAIARRKKEEAKRNK
jgi:small subunit ribosomal protein S21